MAIKLSEKVLSLKPSASIAAKQRVSELQAEGRRIIDLTLGEPDMNTPALIIEAGVESMRAGQTHYTGSAGDASLRGAICEKLWRENSVEYSPEEIVVACGAKQLIQEAFSATLNPGDEVIVPAPYWVSYPDIVRMNGGEPVIVECPAETGFQLSPDALEAAITDRTRWLIINSPGNPSGAVLSEAVWRGILEVLARHPHVALMTDEIYERITYDGARNITPVALDPALKDRCLIVNGMSKAYAMTGWRLGYAAGPRELIRSIVKLIGQSTTCAAAFTQVAAREALQGDQAPVREMVETYAVRRSLVLDALDTMPGVSCVPPGGAFYLFLNVNALLGCVAPDGRRIDSDLDLVSWFLDAEGLAVMDGTSYGMPGFLRLSFAASTETLREGCAAMARAVEALAPEQTRLQKANAND
ncbi:pyridoxal phosphate-dependent aminotransferase [Roseovarius sp. SYSU LYC5161]|uniref:pyridoxal phosphate-dependent aminotransferase n=1 Tax=Roseovarius halophilus (ex Wu et al. 2025) TaxID=3376060 RepID=UPI00399B438A